MDSLVTPLLPLFEREQAAGRAMALAIVLRTAGSTYSKSGALLLIADNGEYAGLLSGGCLEGDLRDRAQAVIASGKPVSVSYDAGPRGSAVGSRRRLRRRDGYFMLQVAAGNGWQPLWHLRCAASACLAAVGIVVVSSGRKSLPVACCCPMARALPRARCTGATA
jgi:hypothetical protein